MISKNMKVKIKKALKSENLKEWKEGKGEASKGRRKRRRER